MWMVEAESESKMDKAPKIARLFAILILFGIALGSVCSSARAADIVDVNSGIDFKVRHTILPDVVEITWKVSGATLSKGANDFEIQFYVGGATGWRPQVSTDEPTDKGLPVFIGGVPELFCFRMVATINGSGPILGSGTSGNSEPCAEDPVPDLVVTGVSVSDSMPEKDGSFTINATVLNQGEGSSTSTTLRYFRSTNATISSSDTQLATDPVGALAVGGSSPESASVSIGTAGTFWVGACVDPVSGESSTGNNCSTGVQVVVNTAPVALDDAYKAKPGRLLEVDEESGVLANDSDGDGDALSASLVSGPSDGVLVLNADGSFEYTSVKGFKGTDEFTYRASDGTDVSHIATVVITVRISVLPGLLPLLLDDEDE